MQRVFTVLALISALFLQPAIASAGITFPIVRSPSHECGYVHADDYRPAVDGCGNVVISQMYREPKMKNGQWVLTDNDEEFILVRNIKKNLNEFDILLEAIDTYGEAVRWGVPRPLGTQEPTPDFYETYSGIYLAYGTIP